MGGVPAVDMGTGRSPKGCWIKRPGDAPWEVRLLGPDRCRFIRHGKAAVAAEFAGSCPATGPSTTKEQCQAAGKREPQIVSSPGQEARIRILVSSAAEGRASCI